MLQLVLQRPERGRWCCKPAAPPNAPRLSGKRKKQTIFASQTSSLSGLTSQGKKKLRIVLAFVWLVKCFEDAASTGHKCSCYSISAGRKQKRRALAFFHSPISLDCKLVHSKRI